MIYPLDEPLYSAYILPLINVLNKYYYNEGIMIAINSVHSKKTEFYVMFDLMRDSWKARSRVLNLYITDKLEIPNVLIKAYPAIAFHITEDIRQIVPQAKIRYAYAWIHSKFRKEIVK